MTLESSLVVVGVVVSQGYLSSRLSKLSLNLSLNWEIGHVLRPLPGGPQPFIINGVIPPISRVTTPVTHL